MNTNPDANLLRFGLGPFPGLVPPDRSEMVEERKPARATRIAAIAADPPRERRRLPGGVRRWLLRLAKTTAALAAFLAVALLLCLPNIINASRRGRQKRTMADIRAAATSVEAWMLDHGPFPAFPEGPAARIESLVAPTYIRQLPATDGWGRPLLFRSTGKGSYEVRSLGADGLLDDPTRAGRNAGFDFDLVFSDGSFTTYPEGVCGI